jgi:uncharacterized coiled-coil DUF342 family protein
VAEESGHPLTVEHVEAEPLGHDKIVIRVTGRWESRKRVTDARTFLVVESEGRRHRFPAMPEVRKRGLGRHQDWTASFTVPAWLDPRHEARMSLWLGDEEVSLPEVVEAPPEPADVPAGNGKTGPSEHRPGGDPATVSALRAELRERVTAEAQLRGQLAAANAQLDARTEHQSELAATHVDLRQELEQLLALIEHERTERTEVESRAVVLAAEVVEFETRVADLTASRDQLTEETAKLRLELERAAREAVRLRDELVELRSATEQEGAERSLLESRANQLSAELLGLRSELAQSEVTCEAAVSEAEGLRSELEQLGSSLARAREITSNSAGLDEAQALLNEARAVTARLREHGPSNI